MCPWGPTDLYLPSVPLRSAASRWRCFAKLLKNNVNFYFFPSAGSLYPLSFPPPDARTPGTRALHWMHLHCMCNLFSPHRSRRDQPTPLKTTALLRHWTLLVVIIGFLSCLLAVCCECVWRDGGGFKAVVFACLSVEGKRVMLGTVRRYGEVCHQ